MADVTTKLTVFFEDPFWVGVFERTDGRKLSVCKTTFGAEPKDYDIYEFILKKYYHLQFSPAVETTVHEKSVNPKKMQREIKRQLSDTGIGTKSQQALKLQYEQNKLERKVKSREEKQAEAEHQFELRQQKKKEKHKGR